MKKIICAIAFLIAAENVFAAQAALNVSTTPPLNGTTMVTGYNSGLNALSTFQAGTTTPTSLSPNPVLPYSWWADTTSGYMKGRDSSNVSWTTLFPLNTRLATQAEAQNASNLSIGIVSNSLLTAGSTSTAGILQLTNSTSSTSVTTAATPNSVKSAYDGIASGAGLNKSLASTGYTQLPGGAYIQWGAATTTATGFGETVTVTLPHALTTCASVVATELSILGRHPTFVINGVCGSTSITFYSALATNGSPAGSADFYWQVIGY